MGWVQASGGPRARGGTTGKGGSRAGGGPRAGGGTTCKGGDHVQGGGWTRRAEGGALLVWCTDPVGACDGHGDEDTVAKADCSPVVAFDAGRFLADPGFAVVGRSHDIEVVGRIAHGDCMQGGGRGRRKGGKGPDGRGRGSRGGGKGGRVMMGEPTATACGGAGEEEGGEGS